jgi:hypothetical protein
MPQPEDQHAAVQVLLASNVISVAPGSAEATAFTVKNLGTQVEDFRCTVTGPPWIAADPASMSVYPGQEATGTVQAAPPRTPESRAGVAPFRLTVTSAVHPNVTGSVAGSIDVAPYFQLATELSPASSTGRGLTRHGVRLDNKGNIPLRVALRAADVADGLRVGVPPYADVAPGTVAEVPVGVQATRRWVGRPESKTFSVITEAPSPLSGTRLLGTRVVQPVFPRWVPLAAGLVVAAAAASALAVPGGLLGYSTSSSSGPTTSASFALTASSSTSASASTQSSSASSSISSGGSASSSMSSAALTLSASASVSPATQSVTCGTPPPAFTFSGSITASGATTVSYYWMVAGTLGTAQSLSFSQAGTMQVAPDQYTPTSDNSSESGSIVITSPSSASSNSASFTLSCTAPPATVISSGTTTLQGTYVFNLDSGTEGGSGDIWWDQETTVARQMVPQSGAMIVNLGTVDFNSLTAQQLQSQSYGSTPIPGNNDSSNQLVNGDVFAVKTASGHYAKVLVQSYGYDLTIQWDTYQLS